jgi:hypothetical protein
MFVAQALAGLPRGVLRTGTQLCSPTHTPNQEVPPRPAPIQLFETMQRRMYPLPCSSRSRQARNAAQFAWNVGPTSASTILFVGLESLC